MLVFVNYNLCVFLLMLVMFYRYRMEREMPTWTIAIT